MQTLSCSRWDLGPRQGLNLGPLHWEQSLSCWTPREVPSPVTLPLPFSLREKVRFTGSREEKMALASGSGEKRASVEGLGAPCCLFSPRRQGIGEEGLLQGEAFQAISGGPQATPAVPSPQKPGARLSPSLLFLNQPSLSTTLPAKCSPSRNPAQRHPHSREK